MKHRWLYTALAFVVLAVPVAAHASTVDFLGSTLGFSRWGDYDAQRGAGTSCTPPLTISSYTWTFDNPPTTLMGNPVTYKFGTNAGGTAKVVVTCSDTSTVTKTRPVCFSFGVPGCIVPDAGYN
ncbi:MAG TPA: hypothetical protein VGS07_12390 [Thermoanaerobaculia bacterium]|jgi:hypothetical protein|nr:hypothetical protein [Thermoanaerobaculia bacterium]